MNTILVVDDEESILGLIRLSLASHDCTVLTAHSSDEAFQANRQFREQIHLLVTDIKMDPYMSGAELAECMRQLRPGIKVLYMSGYPLEGDARSEVERGEAVFLPKPFSPQQLVAMAFRLLEPVEVQNLRS